MTGLCGTIGDSERRVASTVEAMLNAMGRRGPNARSFFSNDDGRHVGLGICDWNQAASQTNPRFYRDMALATDGFFYESETHANSLLANGSLNSLREILAVPGAFSIVASMRGKLFAARDPVGQKPLYYGSDGHGQIAFASLKNPLKEIGTSEIRPVPPGAVLESSGASATLREDRRLTDPPEQETSEANAVTAVGILLEKAVSRGVPQESAVAFSGGIDSSLVAAACKRSGRTPELVTIGVKGQPELDHAHRVALEMGLSITACEIPPSEILSRLPEIVATVESADPVAVGVSGAFYFACERAREMGLTTIVAGQMSDELFGGYARFEELALKGQIGQLRSELMDSVNSAPSNDFEPGDKLAASFKLELRCPFAYLPLVEYALRLPLSMKVRLSSGTAVRKPVLRKLASKWKLPETVVNRPKQAFQYSSGVQKVLRKEARRRRVSLRAMLESLSER